MIFAPPRHGKSEELSRLFSAYYLSLFPDRWVGINSYAAELAYTLSRSARSNYQAVGGMVKDDAAAVKHWETTEGGGLWAAGVGGPITGKGFHLGLIDDPIKNAEEAASETVQKSEQAWYALTFYTREEPGGAIVIMMTRWNENDLCGWLLQQEFEEEPERWHIVKFEAIKEEPEQLKEGETPEFPPTCTIEPDDREVGEPLCKERYPLQKLNKICKRIGTYFWNALYRQRPTAREGNMFKLADLSLEVAAAPIEARRIRYWDLGGSDSTKADYTVGCLMAEQGGLYYIVDVERVQWSPRDRNQKMKDTAESDRESYGVIPTWIEKVPGLAVEVIDNIVKFLAGFKVHTEMAKKDKETRADPFASQCEANNVRIVKAPWNVSFRNELTAFPHGANDDQVDAASGAFSKLAGQRKIRML